MKAVGGVFDDPRSSTVVKVWTLEGWEGWGGVLFRREIEVAGRLLGRSLTPVLIDSGECGSIGWMRTARHLTLMEWLVGRSASEKREMRTRLYDQICRLHDCGICHRDLQLTNVVLSEDLQPLFIDLEISVDVCTETPCYDLYGPSAHVAVPAIHHDLDLEDGVWWDAPWPDLNSVCGWNNSPAPLLSCAFGPL